MITRRSFLSISGAGGLLVVAQLPGCKSKGDEASVKPDPKQGSDVVSAATPASTKAPPLALDGGGQVTAWIHIADNDVITYFVPEAEMGQGIHTAVAMVLSAELGGDWKNAVAATAPLNGKAFGRQGTGGSSSVRGGFEGIRMAGASARELLIRAGAAAMELPAAECEAVESTVRWTKGDKSVGFGEIAEAAAKLEPGPEPTLRKDIELGKETLRLDSFEKATGRAVYSMDVQQPGMLIGKSAHSPSVGGTLKSFDDTAARAVEGVRDVVKTSSSVVVLADHTWAAQKGRDALTVEWEQPNANLSSAVIAEKMQAAVGKGVESFATGNAAGAFKKYKSNQSVSILEADYSVPYLAHAPMEPLACTVKVQGDRCDIWTGTQSTSGVGGTAAKLTGLPIEKVFVHGHYLGGGFGRRSQTDYVAEAVEAAVASGKTVKLCYDREDSIRSYQYRPAAFNKLRAAVDTKAGTLLAWEHAIASPSILKQFGPLSDKIDGTSVDGVLKYAVQDMRVTYADVDLPIPTWFWRSVGHSQNGFVVDGFMNEAAKAAGRDPLEFRLSTKIARLNEEGEVVDNPRLKRVLEAVAEKSGWGKPPPEGVARGISACESFGSFCAQVAEVAIEKGKPRVRRVFCVIDCGLQINPKTIHAQMDSAIAYGLSAALYGNITFEKGGVVEGNFDRYRVVRMNQMPTVETTIIDSTEAHGGVGEPATPPIAGAVAGALFALKGEPIRSLPLS